MDKIYQGKSGTSYMVAETPLASGGEGSIYAIHGYNEFVLKVFKQDRRTREREEKLLKMVGYRLDEEQLKQITWPQDVVYDQSGFVGYVMPRLWENRNLNVVYSTQNNQLDLRHRMLIAYNLCAAIDTVHSLNQVCGDLNPQNICVNLNLQSESALRVTLVDTDSYHITDGDKTYRCEVGLANYLAPEIQNKLINGQDLKSASLPTFTKETDLFALAVHIFSLIMNGCHPFACAKQTDNGYEHTMEAMNDKDCESVVLPQPIDNIKDGFFPFHQERNGVTYPLYAPDFKALPQELQGLFIRAFENGYHNPKERPTTEEWLYVLGKFQSPIEFQQCERKHYYYRNKNNKCPYCEASQRMIRLMHGQGYGIPDTKNDKSDFVQNQKNIIQNQQTTNQNQSVFKSASKPYGGKGNDNQLSDINDNNEMSNTRKKGIAVYVIAAVIIVLLVFTGYIGICKYVAEIAKKNGNYDKAIQQYKNAIDVGYVGEHIYIGLAECYAMQGEMDEAFDAVEIGKNQFGASDEECLEIYKLLAEKSYNLARDFVKQEKYSNAKDILNKCIEKLPFADEKLEDYYHVVQIMTEVHDNIENGRYAYAYEKFSENLTGRDEEEISALYDKTFSGVKEYLNKIVKKIKNEKYKDAYKLMMEYHTKFGDARLWYADGELYDSGTDISEKVFYINPYKGYMYYGEVQSGKMCGKGIEIGEYYEDGVYYYVSGEFKDNYANGECTYFISQRVFSDGIKYKKTIKGNFTDGYEDGVMKEKHVYLDSEHNFQHTAQMGTYTLLRVESGHYVYQDNGYLYSYFNDKEGLEEHGVPRRK